MNKTDFLKLASVEGPLTLEMDGPWRGQKGVGIYLRASYPCFQIQNSITIRVWIDSAMSRTKAAIKIRQYERWLND
jgi:hypothetical protein